MKKKNLFQQGTMQILSEGLLDGSISLEELMEHGDTGIGTGEGIDGELIILNGKGFKINHKGEGIQLGNSFEIAFADVHFENYEKFEQISTIDLDEYLADIKKRILGENIFFSVKIYGEFEVIHTRSSKKSTKPYPNIEKIANNQVEFYTENITGTILSYYSPLLYQGITVAGFHSHFIADDYTIGGHVISSKIKNASVYIQKFASFTQANPIQNNDYLNADLSDISKLDNIIKKVE